MLCSVVCCGWEQYPREVGAGGLGVDTRDTGDVTSIAEVGGIVEIDSSAIT